MSDENLILLIDILDKLGINTDGAGTGTLFAHLAEIEARLTAARALKLDNLDVANSVIAAYVDELESRLTAARAGKLDLIGAVADAAGTSTLFARLQQLKEQTVPIDDIVMFGDGRDGAFNSTGNTVFSVAADDGYYVTKQFTNFTLNTGHNLSIDKRNRGLIIRCTGDVVINGTIDQNNKAARITRDINGVAWDTIAKVALKPSDLPIPLALEIMPSGGSGGAGGYGGYESAYGPRGAPGGGGSNAAFGGSGGGGGASGGRNAGPPGTGPGGGGGGAGGGIIFIGSRGIRTLSGTINVSGSAGGAAGGAGAGIGGGGGGAGNGGIGGYNTSESSGDSNCAGRAGSVGAGTGASGGAGYASGGNGGAGGAGGGGIIVLLVKGTITLGSGGTITAASTGAGGVGGTGGTYNAGCTAGSSGSIGSILYKNL